MTNLQEMQALQDAHRIIRKLACEAASGTVAVWRILDHANQHINSRMTDLLGDTLQGHPWPFSGGPGAAPAPKCGCTISYPCSLHSATSSVEAL